MLFVDLSGEGLSLTIFPRNRALRDGCDPPGAKQQERCRSAPWPVHTFRTRPASRVCTILPKRQRHSLQVFQRLKGPFFPLKKMPGKKQKTKNKRGRREFSTAVTISQSQTAALRSRCRGSAGRHRLYLGSSITPLLRSVILGYFTFF